MHVPIIFYKGKHYLNKCIFENILCFRILPQNALGFRHFAESLGCSTLADSAEKYIESYFHEVSQHEEYLIQIKDILGKNDLRVDRQAISILTL